MSDRSTLMKGIRSHPRELLEALRALPTPAVSNAIERFDVRPRDTGFMRMDIRSIFPRLPAAIGYAATARIVCAHDAGAKGSPPMPDYWHAILNVRRELGPVMMVMGDLDVPPGLGTFMGEVNANLHKSAGCEGFVTNGGLRDVPELEALGLPCWAAGVVVSHGYSHVVDFGSPVRVGGLTVNPGDLLLADLHGVVLIPHDIAADVPEMEKKVAADEKVSIEYAKSVDWQTFSPEALRERNRRAKDYH